MMLARLCCDIVTVQPIHAVQVLGDNGGLATAAQLREFCQRFGGALLADGWEYSESCMHFQHERNADYNMDHAMRTLENNCGLVRDDTLRRTATTVNYRVPPSTPMPPIDFGERLYAQREGTCADFAFVSAAGTEFKVHKNVLAVRSDVFQRAFNNGELNEHCLDLKDNKLPLPYADDKAVGAFIKAIYTGVYELKYAEEEETVLALLQLVDMYMLADIKSHIERDLIRCANVENACAMAALVDTYALDELRKKIFGSLYAAGGE